ncbi:alpha/beta fold hydrolase [Mucilaginibacter sp. L3T2-6]|uniref:alpha/beta fold hydrolase n=1 Tax=Mucilaginibacter sp. L3T2-6 TaxID=3062491 RepID=UPI0026771080|nr:alpha/beta hydrolase [Mucilaginibacter sp. L3T2-6]MDO3640881.1 alpha/beta hydrolase [Mucilaginibacter sp. L3T2-6]MDV6213643.1 alpha/beta hydrolase [Mucilaginibacter sp. L3T2-6]
MPVVTANNIQLYYEVSGEGEAVLLMHGHPFDHTMWNPQIAVFSRYYKVVAPDLRGYGKSSLPSSGITRFEDYATDALALMDELKIQNFHVAGLSQGGQFIMEIFRQAPHRVKSLIFCDTFASLDTPEAKQARYAAAERMESEGMGGYANESIHKMIKADHVQSMPAVAELVMNMMLHTSPAAAATAMRARCERIDYLHKVLPDIDIPALIIVGRQDEFTPVAKAQEIQQNVQGSKLVIIEDAGHMPNLEHPDEFNKIVLGFLERISHRQGSPL